MYKSLLLKLLIIFIASGGAFIRMSALVQVPQDFIKTHSISSNIEGLLDMHLSELMAIVDNHYTRADAVKQFSWLPGYFIKYNADRVKNAESMRTFIKERHLDLLIVPEKYYYHVKGRPEEFSNKNYLVISKKVPTQKRLEITLPQMEQLLILFEGHKDLDNHAGNIVLTPDGKLAIIDTEPYASWKWQGEDAHTLSDEKKAFLGLVRFVAEDGHFLELNLFNQQAYDFLIKKISNYVANQKKPKWYTRIVKRYIVEWVEQLPQPWRWDYREALTTYKLI